MLFKTEIKQLNTLTKRFQRDAVKVVAGIKERIPDGGLTKAEVKSLVENFGELYSIVFIQYSYRIMQFLEPHLTTWEERLFGAINQLDRFLTNLETVI